MQPRRSRGPHAWPFLSASFSGSALAWGVLSLSGCASPGPPRPPSLQLPRLVSDLSAARSGDTIILRFTLPQRTTDGLPLRAGNLFGGLCRQVGSDGPCTPVDTAETKAPLPVATSATAPVVMWIDVLPLTLREGAPRPVAYRVELSNARGRSAGFSDPVYAAAGAAPPEVTGLEAQGVRLGVRLRWTPVAGAGEVLVERNDLPTSANAREPGSAVAATQSSARGKGTKAAQASPPGKPHATGKTPGQLVLQADPGNASAGATLDTGVQEGVPYSYTAMRREVVQMGGRRLELRSAPSTAVTVLWREVYPPAVPSGLAALGYAEPANTATQATAPGYAVDLIWQPVEDARLAGYLVYRQTLNAAGEPTGERERLTPQPVSTPGFHDATARPERQYRYSVTTIDPKGNESAAATAVVKPSAL